MSEIIDRYYSMPEICKYLGITLFPQAGVALGMVSTVAGDKIISADIANVVRFVILFAVLVYELVGPMLTKMALTKAGDIQPEGRTSARHAFLHFRHIK